MIDDLRVLAVILARGGSKRLPGKNIRPLAGKPLIAWTIEAGRASRHVDRLVLSSDDAQISAVAERFGCEVPFMRPQALAQDDTPSMPVVLHALDALGEPFDLIVLLQPTSPLRTAEDIDACLERCVREGRPACVSVTEARKPPSLFMSIDAAGRLQPLLPAAGSGPSYILNGAVYVARTPWLRRTGSFMSPETGGHVMPAERSIDIDDPMDFALAELSLLSGTRPNR